MKIYSQNNEQTYIRTHFENYRGRFLDIGAYDGITFSNTYSLVLDGWSGVMIEGSPMTFEMLKTNITQPNIDLVHALVDIHESREVEFYDNIEATATMNKSNYDKWIAATPFTAVKMQTTCIDEIIAQYGVDFDFVNIDVEGGSTDLFMHLFDKMPSVSMWVIEHDDRQYEIIEACNGYRVLYMNGENIILARNFK